MTASLTAVHPVLASNDVAASIQFYRRLGFELRFQDHATDPKYVVVNRDGVELHIQWADAHQWVANLDRPAYRIMVTDVDAIYGEFTRSGALSGNGSHGSPWAVPADTPWGTREFHVRDPGQNSLQFYRAR
jgi:catechol 2,3-dioxygenase-like lactoylglutathione lyase family enzyme